MKISKMNAPHYLWGQQCDGWHLVQQDELSIIHERMPSDTAEVMHYHQHSRQFFFVLKGIATIEVGGVVYQLSPQEGIEVEPNVWHQMRNETHKEIEFLVISQPKSHGDRMIKEA